MGYRLTKIYTRRGDDGSTGLGDGSRMRKDALRLEAIGTLDELNSSLGLLLADESLDAVLREALQPVQNDLFDLGGELSLPGRVLVDRSTTERLEAILDRLNAELPPLENFVLPGGGTAAAYCHLARSICRRAERRLVSLAAEEEVSPLQLSYLNRLSDLLFVCARRLARNSSHGEVLWQPGGGEGRG